MRTLFIKYIDTFARHFKSIGLKNDLLQEIVFYFYTFIFVSAILFFLFLMVVFVHEGFVAAFSGLDGVFLKFIFLPIYISITIKTLIWIIDRVKKIINPPSQ